MRIWNLEFRIGNLGRPPSAVRRPTSETQSPKFQFRNPRFQIPNWVEPVAVTLFFVALTLAMTWPWALYMAQAINPFGDVVVQMTSIRWNAHALTTNPLGLFEAPFFYPYAHSFAFSENLLGQTLVALPLLWLTGNPALANNFNILLSFVLTGIFTYLLVRDLTGSRAAGILSGVAFAFCPFRFMQMGHLHMLATQWFPFTLWALGKGLAYTQHRSAITWFAWAAFGFVAMGLSSVYYTYFLALAVLLYLAWWIAVEGRRMGLARREWGRLALRLGLAGLVAVVALAPVFIPYLQSNIELGFSRSTYEVQNWAAEWSYYGKVLQSNWLYGQVLAPRTMASALGERELFIGVVPMLLAGIGLFWGRSRERFFYALLGLLALVLTFGMKGWIPFTRIEIPLPYGFLYEWVPGFKALRVPVRFALLVDFAVYVLAGYGLARLLEARGRRFIGVGAKQPERSEGPLRVARPAAGRMVIAVALTALVLLEFANPLDTRNRRDVMAELASSEIQGWLGKPENSGPVLDLPMSAGQEDVWYTFFATRHWQPLVNGWSSFVPPGTVRLKQALDRFPDRVSVTLLQGLEVRHVVVRLWQYPQESRADLKRRLDAMPQLEMVYQVGEEYVYRIAPDPWLRRMAGRVGDGTLWVGEARQNALPTLEVLAYALRRWGVSEGRMGGNIDIGYRPIGALPFGAPADYALVPNVEAAGGVPFGFEGMEEVESNAAVRLLKRQRNLLRSYNLTHPQAPRADLSNLRMQVGSDGVAFGDGAPLGTGGARLLGLAFVAFTEAEVTIKIGERRELLRLPAGVSRYTTRVADVPQSVVLSDLQGDARLMRVDLLTGEAAGDTDGLAQESGLMPLTISSSVEGNTLITRLRVVPPRREEQFTLTLDVYVEPWGTHPEGHFGSWSVVLPADGTAHEYSFRMDAVTKAFSTTRDGAPAETFGWEGPPTQGDFRGTLTILDSTGQVANSTLYTFTRGQDDLENWLLEPATLYVARPGKR